MTQMKRPFLIEHPITVKTYDVDFASIVHNMVYIRWLEDLRLQLLQDTYSVEAMLADGIGPILTRTEIAYTWPTRFGDSVVGRMWVKQVGRVRWTVAAEIVAGEKIAATATQTGYFASMETMRPVRMPAVLRERWRELQ